MEDIAVRLRAPRVSDAERMLLWMNDPESVTYLGSGFSKPRELSDVRQEIELKLAGEFTGETLVIARADTDEYLGQCELMLPDTRARSVELAIVVLPEARNKGVAKQALRLLCRHAFEERGYERLYLKCAALNEAAVRLYEGSGFVREGTLRRALMTSNGISDVHIYALLKTDYRCSPPE